MKNSFHPIFFDPRLCRGHRSCLRACPTQAVRIRSGRAKKIADLCIDCGECIKVCERHAVRSVTHSMRRLSRFDCAVAVPSVALYTQLDAPPSVVHRALTRCGFSAVASISSACDEASVAIGLYVTEHRDRYPLLASDCPTVVRLVQARYPSLVDRLLPLLPPRELAGRAAREQLMASTGLAPHRIGVIYITPCPSKMVSILEHPGMRHSHLDAAVSIAELFPAMLSAARRPEGEEGPSDEPETAGGLRWAWVGGRSDWLSEENSLSVAGLGNVIRILDDLEKGRLTDYALISPAACIEGCVSGPLTVEDPYVARARAIHLTRTLADVPPDRTAIEARYRAGDYLNELPLEQRPPRLVPNGMDKAIARMRERELLFADLPGIDCGACGAPSCAAFADDVASGAADRLDCIFLRGDGARSGVECLKEERLMTVSEAVRRLEGRLVTGHERASETVHGGYASDLLSDVMANAQAGDLWVTLQRHANIVAVASVRELAGVVLVAGREPEEPALLRAREEGVPIIVTPLRAFEAIGRLHGAGLHGREG